MVAAPARAGLILALALLPLAAQFNELSTTYSGSQAYFSSTLFLPGGKPYNWPKLFVANEAGVKLYAEREPAPPPQFSPYYNSVYYQLLSAEFSADGRVTVLGAYRPCTGGSGCLNVERGQSTVLGSAAGAERTYTGKVRISPNGRYAISWGSTVFFPSPRPQWIDFETGRFVQLSAGAPASRGRVVADDGTALTLAGDGTLAAEHPDRKVIVIGRDVLTASIDPRARFVLYQTRYNVIRYRDLYSGFDFALLEDATGCRQPVLSDDGHWLVFVSAANWEGRNTAMQPQVWRMDLTDGSVRQLTTDATGIDTAAFSGDGNVVWATTLGGQVVRTDVNTLATLQVIGRTPTYEGALPALIAPGSQYVLYGRGFTDAAFTPQPPYPVRLGGVELSANGMPLPLLYVSPSEIRFSVPWETPAGSAVLAVQSSQSPFMAAPPYAVDVAPVAPHFYTLEDPMMALAAHGDFLGIVDDNRPAEPGEIVHFYMAGLGPVMPAFPADRPAPGPARILSQLRWTWYDEAYATSPAEVLYAGLAPGFTGIYQVSVRLPLSFPGTRLRLYCETTDGYPSDMGTISVRQP